MWTMWFYRLVKTKTHLILIGQCQHPDIFMHFSLSEHILMALQSRVRDRKWPHTFGYGLLLNLLRCYIVQPGCVGFDTPERLLDQGYLSSQIDSFIYFIYIQNRFVCFLCLLNSMRRSNIAEQVSMWLLHLGFNMYQLLLVSTPGCV